MIPASPEANPATMPDTAEQAPPLAAQRPIDILIVEDSPDALDLLLLARRLEDADTLFFSPGS